jgi:hypothetical protein
LFGDTLVPDEQPETDRATTDATPEQDTDPEGRELTGRLDEPGQDQSDSGETGPQTEPREDVSPDGKGSWSDPQKGDQTPGDTEGRASAAAVRGDLTTLTGDGLSALVADLWEAKGWSTTVFKTTGEAVYDILAVQQDPEYRMLLWAPDLSDRDPLGSTMIERCAAVRDSSDGADSATLVTNGSISEAASERARELDLRALGLNELTEQLLSEGVRDRVRTAVEQDRKR